MKEQIKEMAQLSGHMTEKTCNSCIHFGACSKWTDFPKQCGVPVCASFAQQSEKYLIKENGDILPLTHHSEWISVTERLPETNVYVLLYAFFHNHWQIVKGWLSYCDKQFHITNSDYPSLTDIPVTHWMPLPSAPKGE